MFALHHVYIPRINRALHAFTQGWNNHPLSSCHSQSPMQLYTKGMAILQHSGIPALEYTSVIDDVSYGIEMVDDNLLQKRTTL